jgi:signal transduction histidine kinase
MSPTNSSAYSSAYFKINKFVNRWLKNRFAFPLLLVLAAAVLWVSEETYRNTTSTLAGGISLTDARIESLRLLQMMTEAESAQFGFLTTGQSQYLERYTDIKRAAPEVLGRVSSYFQSQASGGAAGAQRLADLAGRSFVQIDRAMALANSGQSKMATDLVQQHQTRTDILALRTELLEQLALATQLQQRARTSIYDSLLINRLAVGSLTLVTLLMLFLFVRQLHRQDRESAVYEAGLVSERGKLEVQVQRRTARLAELAQHLQTVSETERSRLARELHDELGGLLTACKLDVARARRKLAEPSEMLLALERISEHLNQGIALKRRVIEDLRPSALADLGLTTALENLADEMGKSLGVPVQLSAVEIGLSPQAELAVYRFVQEALTNIGKYARAKRISVRLEAVGGKAIVTVQDDGVGFDTDAPRTGHHGLSGMQFRAESMGGSMRVTSTPGRGTAVVIEFPQSAKNESTVPQAP